VRFTGEVRVPEVDHPGVPATFLIEDDQAEIFLEGESLGRWSLFDVHASRLLSAAFTVALSNEELTFIADEPVDFAYRGVEHMATIWAGFKAMSMPRRVVAVGRSRRGTTPSRIADLRAAMLQNLEAEAPPITSEVPETTEATWIPPTAVDAPSSSKPFPGRGEPKFRPAGLEGPAEVASAEVVPLEVAPVEVVSEEGTRPFAEPDEMVGEAARPNLRPGPGVLRPAQVPEPEPAAQPVADDPLREAAPAAEPPFDEPEPEFDEASRERVLHVPWIYDGDGESPYAESEPEPVADSIPVPDAPAPLAPTLSDEPSEGLSSDDTGDGDMSEIVEELLRPDRFEPADDSDDDEEAEHAAPKGLVVDLGRFEGRRDDGAQPEDPPAPDDVPDRQPVLAATEATDRGGLLGAVRSAFVRNRVVDHDHQFVEAPGGIGIVRQICEECGYISIGVSD
jgi:hypothetical protein